MRFGARRVWSGRRTSDGPSKFRTRDIRSTRMWASKQRRNRSLSNWQSQLGIGTIQEPAGATNLARNRLMVDAPNLQWARSIGIHELKHLIDWIEKHPPGGSPRQFMEVGVPEQEAHDLYNRLVGEVAARNAQKRLDWGDMIRRLRRPAVTEDVPRDRQFNLYDDTWP